MQPYDYGLEVQQPFQSVLQGYQAGMAIRSQQQKQAQEEAARQAHMQMQADLDALSQNRTATSADYASMMTRYPQLSEHLKRASDTMNDAQQHSFIEDNAPVFAALHNNRPDVAERIVRDRAAAMRNSGMEDEAKTTDVLAEMIRLNPGIARSSVALRLAGLPGGDKLIDSITKLGNEDRAAAKAPADLRKAEADAAKSESDATTAGVQAKYAERGQLADLEVKGWNVKALQADIDYKRQSARIAAMNASMSGQSNDLKRAEVQLKVDEAQAKLDAQVAEKVSSAEMAANAVDNMLNTIERLKKNKRLDAVVGGIEGWMPAVRDESADAIALIDNVKAQAFLAQIPAIKGTGQLSNIEGDKIQNALQNLTRVQSEKQFRENLDEAARLLTKTRVALSKKTGVPLGKPDTPAAPGARPPLSSFYGSGASDKY